MMTDKHDVQKCRPTWRKQGEIGAPSKVHRAAASDQDKLCSCPIEGPVWSIHQTALLSVRLRTMPLQKQDLTKFRTELRDEQTVLCGGGRGEVRQ
jgi:hypothetical protein